MKSKLAKQSAHPPRAIITGASSGIGREIALALAKKNYRLLLIARRADKLRELTRWLKTETHALPLDLADPSAISDALPDMHLDDVNVLINNAGSGDNRRLLDQPDHLAHDLMQVHYFSPLALIRAALPHMLKSAEEAQANVHTKSRTHNKRRVINVASIATKWAPAGHSTYAAAKCALIALTQSLASDYPPSQYPDLYFSYVNPGLVRTEFFQNETYKPLAATLAKRGLPADRVAKKIVRLIAHPRPELCIPSHYRLADLIKAISPRLMRRIVHAQSNPTP